MTDLAVEKDAFVERLRAYLEEIHEDIPGCIQLKPGNLIGLVAQALDPSNNANDALSFASKELAKVWPEDYEPGMNQRAEVGDAVSPIVVVAVVARIDDRFVVRIQSSESRKASPGTAFPELSPWQKSFKAKTHERRFRAWADGLQDPTTSYLDLPLSAQGVECTVEAALSWVADVGARAPGALFGPGPRAAQDDPATDKQIGFVASLGRKKGLDTDAFERLLRSHGLVEYVEELQKGPASDLIEALLALPDAEKPSRVRPPSKAPKPKKARKKTLTAPSDKVAWSGKIVAVQPRIRQRIQAGEAQHSYQGFVLLLEGKLGDVERTEPFGIGIGKGAQAKHGFQVGDEVSGLALPVADPRQEVAGHYKTSKLALLSSDPPGGAPPPHTGAPVTLPEYRASGHRPLAATAYAETCMGCVWACKMPVEDAGDWRFQTVCYGPKNCFFHSE